MHSLVLYTSFDESGRCQFDLEYLDSQITYEESCTGLVWKEVSAISRLSSSIGNKRRTCTSDLYLHVEGTSIVTLGTNGCRGKKVGKPAKKYICWNQRLSHFLSNLRFSSYLLPRGRRRLFSWSCSLSQHTISNKKADPDC